jgi:hypothetical protein
MSSFSNPNADPDPEGLKRAKMKKKNAANRQIIRNKNQCNWCGIKMVATLISLKLSLFFDFAKKIFLTFTQDPDGSAFIFKAGSGSAFT